MTETRDQRRERKRAEARGIEQFREHIGDPAPLTMAPQAVYHWTRDDQAEALVEAREAEPDTGFMMRLLALCTLPRTNPGKRQQYRRVNGPFRLYLIAGGDTKLPYGSIPRLLLAWVCTEAVRTQSRTLVLGRSLSEFMRSVGLNPSGSGDRVRLRNQMDRLFSASVQLVFERDGRSASIGSLVADRTDFWWDPRRPDEPVLWDSTIRLGEDFFNEIIARPVPLDVNVLKAMKRSSLGLDLYLWLTYRLFGMTEPFRLTWRQLYRNSARTRRPTGRPSTTSGRTSSASWRSSRRPGPGSTTAPREAASSCARRGRSSLPAVPAPSGVAPATRTTRRCAGTCSGSSPSGRSCSTPSTLASWRRRSRRPRPAPGSPTTPTR